MRLRGPKLEHRPRQTHEYQPGSYPGAAPHPDSGYTWQPKKRGKIRCFSRQSRGRMMEQQAGLNLAKIEAKPLFLTLTYPDSFPTEVSETKAHLAAFRMQMERRYPGYWARWKLEIQERGAPHYHLLVYNVPFIHYRWLARVWNAIVAPGDEAHLAAGTQVRRVKSHRQAMYYAAKYMAKLSAASDIGEWGRRWGVWNAKYQPLVLVVAPIAAEVAHVARRWLWKYQRAHGYRRRGRRGRWDGTKAWMSWEAFDRMMRLAEGNSRAPALC